MLTEWWLLLNLLWKTKLSYVPPRDKHQIQRDKFFHDILKTAKKTDKINSQDV